MDWLVHLLVDLFLPDRNGGHVDRSIDRGSRIQQQAGWIVVGMVLLGVIGAAVYYFFFR